MKTGGALRLPHSSYQKETPSSSDIGQLEVIQKCVIAETLHSITGTAVCSLCAPSLAPGSK